MTDKQVQKARAKALDMMIKALDVLDEIDEKGEHYDLLDTAIDHLEDIVYGNDAV